MIPDRSLLAGAEEAQLLAGVAAGDLSCLQEIYRRHGHAVLDLALALVVDQDAAEVAASEAFVHLWDHPDGVAPPTDSVADFLLEQTRRVCRDAVARAAPNARRPGDEAAPPRRPSLADPALHEDERRALELAVRGTTYKVIAQRLGEPEDVVMGWLTSGLKKLSE